MKTANIKTIKECALCDTCVIIKVRASVSTYLSNQFWYNLRKLPFKKSKLMQIYRLKSS